MPERGKGSIAALLKILLAVRISVSADIFDAKTNVAHQYKEASDKDGNNDVSSVVTPTPPCAIKSRLATTTPKMSTFLNQSADTKVRSFGKFEFLDGQRSHRENFDDNPMIFPDNPTNHNKTMAKK